ncbi:MAG TPA: D-aminoacylase [Gemmatimonadales bacterium]|nr:D-aminoacylase [Gemmatimonadales bacterium]
MEKVICAGLALLAAAACQRPKPSNTTATPPPSNASYDVLLTGGWIVDGSGNPRWRGDLGVRGDRIAAIGRLTGTAKETLDVKGLVVAPGFIDMLGQSETNVLIDNRALSKVTQGITTEVTGEGGSVAPLTDRLVALDSEVMKKYKFSEDWRDLDGYFARLEHTGSTINIATFVGATQVRMAVIGFANRPATGPEQAHMEALVDSMMEQGALGVSTALLYAPAIYAPTEELIGLARAARRHGGIYASHIRNEAAHEDEALDEVFRIAQAADIPAEIWHFKAAGQQQAGRMPHLIQRIDSARAAGLDITADQYPYTAAATSLDASIPQWAHAGGTDSLLARLRDRPTRTKLRTEMLTGGGDENPYINSGGADGVEIAGVFQDSLRYLDGRRLGEIARERKKDPIELLFDIVLADRAHTGAIYFEMNEDDVKAGLRTWWVAVDCDASGVAPDGPFGKDYTHPRAYGTFPRILGGYVRQQHLMPLEFAVRKMTSLAAQRVGLADRGLLRPGLAADITVFDPETVNDRATFEKPHQPSVGITYVLVNGQIVLRRGEITPARPGRGLRGPGYVPSDRRGRGGATSG